MSITEVSKVAIHLTGLVVVIIIIILLLLQFTVNGPSCLWYSSVLQCSLSVSSSTDNVTNINL